MSFFLKSLFICFAILLAVPASILPQTQSKLYGEKIDESKLIELTLKIKKDKSFTKDDIDLFTGGLLRLSEIKDGLKGKTVGKIIEEQKEFNRQASLTNLNTSIYRLIINNLLSVHIAQKFKVINDTINADGIEFELTNTSKLDITGIKGTIKILNSQNQTVKLITISYDKNFQIKTGGKITKREVWKHNAENQYDEYYRNNSELLAYWIPDEISFSNGKKLSVTPPKETKDKK